jgi:hypothetical protein
MVIPRCCSSSLRGDNVLHNHPFLASGRTHLESRNLSLPASLAEMIPFELTRLSDNLSNTTARSTSFDPDRFYRTYVVLP